MKNNSIDQIFRDKIGELEKVPPQDAWNKINNGLQGKRKVTVWIALKAAVIALLCIAAAYLAYNTTADQKRTDVPVAGHPAGSTITGTPDNHSLPEKPNPPQTAGVQDKNPYPDKPDKENKEIAVRENRSPKTKTAEKGVQDEKADKAAGQEKTRAAEPETPASDRVNSEQLASVTPPAGPVEPGKEPETKEAQTGGQKLVITIIYRSGSNSEPVLAAENPEAEPSALEKIVGTARDIREGELSLAELREAKDALFALNFKSEKE